MATETLNKRTVKREPKLTEASRQAIIAAVAAGTPQTTVAQQFGIHRNTVWSLCNNVKRVENPGNPFAADYKPVVKQVAYKALIRGMQHDKDPYRAAELAVSALEGTGEFVTGKQAPDVNMAFAISWGDGSTMQKDAPPVINVTPQDVVDANPDES